MECKMCDLKTSKRHLIDDGSYVEQCDCGWVSRRYRLLDNGELEWQEDEENKAYFIEETVDIPSDNSLGFCKECGVEIYPKHNIPGYENIYECPACYHTHSKDELWEEKPYYLTEQKTDIKISSNDIVLDDKLIQFAKESEEEFGLEHKNLSTMDLNEICKYIEWLDYLWEK